MQMLFASLGPGGDKQRGVCVTGLNQVPPFTLTFQKGRLVFMVWCV